MHLIIRDAAALAAISAFVGMIGLWSTALHAVV